MSHLAEGDTTFLGTHAASFNHDEIIVNLAIMRETTHRRDGLLSQIVFSRGVVLDNL